MNFRDYFEAHEAEWEAMQEYLREQSTEGWPSHNKRKKKDWKSPFFVYAVLTAQTETIPNFSDLKRWSFLRRKIVKYFTNFFSRNYWQTVLTML